MSRRELTAGIFIVASIAIAATFAASSLVSRIQQTDRTTFHAKQDGFKLLPESSGKFSRRQAVDGDVTDNQVIWRDGSVDHYRYKNGVMVSFERDSKEGVRLFQALYQGGITIRQFKSWHADGSLSETLDRDADGTETRVVYADNGRELKRTVVHADGSGQVTDTASDGTSSVTQVAATESSTPLGSQKTSTGTDVPVFKLLYHGARLAGFEWSKPDNSVSQKGTFALDGTMVINTYLNGHLRLVQTYNTVFEDWNRRFYRLKHVTVYFSNDETKVDRILDVNDNGTLARWEDFSLAGGRNFIRVFDSKGLPLTNTSWDKDGKPTVQDLTKQAGRSPQRIDNSYGPFPGGGSVGFENVRVTGVPYDAAYAGSKAVETMFVTTPPPSPKPQAAATQNYPED